MVVAAALSACRGERRAGGVGGVVVDTIGGVPSVMSPERGLLGDTVPWDFTQYLLVAGDQLYDGLPAEYALDVGIVPNGNVVVLDTGNGRVLRFDSAGVYIGSFGGRGEEPDRFRTPMFLEVAGDRIYVLDTGLNRVSEFDSAGIFLGRFQIDLGGLAGTTPLFAAGGPDEIYLAAEPVPFLQQVRDTGKAVIYRFDMSGAIVDTVAFFRPSSWTRIETGEGRSSYVRPRLAPTPRISAEPGRVAVVTGARYYIELRRPDASLTRRIARRYENAAVTPEIRDSILSELERGPGGLPRDALELIPFAAVVPAVEAVLLDDRGRLWVDPYDPDPTRWDVFDPEGRFLGPVYLPQPVELEDVRGDRACGVIRQLTGQAAVVCYRVEEAGVG